MAENEMELKNPFSAIKYAVKALPDETETKPILPSSELTLSNILSVFSYQSDLPYSFMELPGSIKDLEYANDGKTIVVKTTKTDDIKSLSQVARTLYLIDSSNLEIKQSYSDVYDYIIENQNPVYLADKDREDNAEKKKGDIALFFSNSLTIIDCDTYEKKWEKTGDNYMFCKIKYNNNYLPCVLNKANYNIEVYDFSGEMLTSFDISSIIPKTKYGIENLFLSKDKSKAAIIISEYEDSPIKTGLVGYYFEIYDNNIRATNKIDDICKRNFYVHVADVDVEKGFFICTTNFSGSNEESFCLDINNKILWKKDIHIGDESQIQTVEMKNQKYELLIIDDYDCLSMIKAETGEEILNFDHPKEYWNNIELTSNGILYYTTSDAVYCINVCEHFTENKNESKLSKKISTEISLLDFYKDEYIIAERMKRGTSKVYQYKKIFKNKDFQCISEGDDDVNFLGMSPNGKYIIFEDVKYNGSFYPYAKDKVNKVYLYDIETDKKRFIEEYIGYEYGRYFFVNDNILKIGTEYYDVELNPISLALDIALLSKGYNFLDDPDGKMCIIEWLDKDGNYNKSDFDIGSSGQPSKTIISPDKSKILFQYNKEKPNHDSSTDLNSYDTFIISFNNGSYAKCVKADTDLSNYSDCSWINNDEVAFSFIDHVLIIDATSGKTVSDILPYDEKTKYRCNHILANTSGDHKTLLITSFDRKLLKVDRNSGFVKIIQNLSYLESKGEDYKVSLIPGSDDLILTETIHMGGVPATVKSVTYVINTETLGIRYILSGGGVIAYPSGFCGYSEETDSVIIIDGNILGYCPLYTTEELVEKAKNFLKQKDKNFY